MFTGRISDTIRMNTLQMKWKQRLKDPNMSKGDENPEIAELRKRAEENRRSSYISSLDSKLKSGKTLTSEELNWLKENQPELYQEAVKIQREREAYKKKLEKCRTKEDVERLHKEQLQGFFSEAQAIMRTNLPKLKKAIEVEKILKRMSAVLDEHSKFISSDRYNRLPEEDEEKENEKNKIENEENKENKENENKVDKDNILSEIQKQIDELLSSQNDFKFDIVDANDSNSINIPNNVMNSTNITDSSNTSDIEVNKEISINLDGSGIYIPKSLNNNVSVSNTPKFTFRA